MSPWWLLLALPLAPIAAHLALLQARAAAAITGLAAIRARLSAFSLSCELAIRALQDAHPQPRIDAPAAPSPN